MLRLSKLSDYGVVLATSMARQGPERIYTVRELAATTEIPAATVSKVLKALQQAELLESFRGATGGYRLGRTPDAISVAEVICALDGPIGLNECAQSDASCELQDSCNLTRHWERINVAVREILERTSLAEMASPLPRLRRSVRRR